MTGMGFNNLDGWPGDGISHVRIWDRFASEISMHSSFLLSTLQTLLLFLAVEILGTQFILAMVR